MKKKKEKKNWYQLGKLKEEKKKEQDKTKK